MATSIHNLFLVAGQVAILFILIGVGALCRKIRLIDEFSIRGMVNVLILIVTPAIVIDCFQRPFEPAMLRQLALAFVFATLAHLVAIALSRLVAYGDARSRPVLRLAAVFSNAGFMGIPLEYAILGPDGVLYGIAYVAMFNVFMWSWGLRVMKNAGGGMTKGDGRWKMLVNPGTVGIAIGLPLFLFSVQLPSILGKPVHMLAELNTPLAMLVIGYYLAGANLRRSLWDPAVHVAMLMRLVVFPLVVVGGLCLARDICDRTMALAIVMAASAPVAAMVTMFASKYDRNVDMSVGLVSGTTLLSIVTIPAIVVIAMACL